MDAFASLQPVVDRAVDDVAAGLDRAHNRSVILLVGGVVVISQIGAEADGGHPKTLHLAKVLGRNFPGESSR